MNTTEHVALVDTSRDELRERIALAHERFDRLVRTADPLARPPGHDWTVQQIVAHVLTLAHRYRQFARGLDYRPAGSARGIATLNQIELEAAMAPVPELEDVAQAMKAPWDISERDMLLVLRGAREFAAGYLRPGVAANVDACVAFRLPEARPYLIHIHDGTAEMRERRPDDRPDAVLRLPASTLVQLLYQRIGQLAALRRGLRLVGGRRPWVALKLMTYFERV
jgi:hypothetical protein